VPGLEFRTNSTNPNPRVACALLLDTSRSMGDRTVRGESTAIDELNAGFAAFCRQIKTDDLAKKRAEISVITFGGEARVAIGFTEGRDLQPQTFKAAGATPMGHALHIAVDELTRQKQDYKHAGLLYYRPWLFIVTDGAATDVPEPFDSATRRVRELEAAKGVNVFAIGVGNHADFDQLSRLSDVRQPLRLKGLSFSEFFLWLSASMSAASTSDGAAVSGGNDQSLSLPPAAWGEIAL
jgi:uncharacterized protein YegL